MTAVVYAHKAGRGNGVGLHYSRFRPSWRSIIPPNQRLGLMPPAQNRHFPPRIREVGLANSLNNLSNRLSDIRDNAAALAAIREAAKIYRRLAKGTQLASNRTWRAVSTTCP